MADEPLPFNLLKTFPGILHRQPLFITKQLDVDSYHLSFLDKQGQELSDDSDVPNFIEQLPEILPAINDHHKVLLSIPESWQESLLSSQPSDFDFILNNKNSSQSNQFSIADTNNTSNNESDTLLINLAEFKPSELTEHLPYWRNNHAILCATNVNNLEQFSFCQQNKLDLLQGQFHTLPSNTNSQKISPSSQILMELLVKLQDPEVVTEELADIINRDISLSYKLLRLINSAFFGLKKEVETTKQAIMLLGLSKIKTWGSLLSLSGIDDKPKELRVVAMTRAKMCELLAKYYKGQPDTFFAAGLFSTLDALIDKPLPELLTKLPLSDELKQGLTSHSGIIGRALHDVLSYEKGDWVTVNASPLPIEIIARSYLEAINWAQELNSEILD